MATKYDVLIKCLEVLEKIDIECPSDESNKQKETIVKVFQKYLIIGENIMGDKFENIRNSTIVNRSLLSKALNNITSQYGDEYKEALEEISSYIDQCKNKDSGELLDSFNEAFNKEKPNKSVLKVLWDGLVKSLPDAAKVATAIATISKIFL